MSDTPAVPTPSRTHNVQTTQSRLLPLTLTALGVVYGDIGTSPLYAMRECFFGSHSVPPTHDNVLGVLSLIIYALLLVISIKYVLIVMRADNQGEGGILALTALVPGREGEAKGTASRLAVGRPVLIALGIFGTALLYGDGMITPAISVLGAIEGLEVATPLFTPYVVPITVAILVVLFSIQRFGTHRVGSLFGPIVIIWFLSIAALGIVWIVRAPAVVSAFNPGHAITFFERERWRWPRAAALSLMLLFLTIDGAFFGANALKILDGGWVTLAVAWALFTVMTTWRTGRRILADRLTVRALPLEEFMQRIVATAPVRVSGTAVFMTAQPTGTPPALAHNLQYNKVLHEHVVVLTVTTAQTPHVAEEDRARVVPLGQGVFNVKVQYGFMEDPDVPAALFQARERGLEIDLNDLTYFLGRETILVTRKEGMALWREKLFVLMARNAVRPISYFRLPPERVVELGVQVEM